MNKGITTPAIALVTVLAAASIIALGGCSGKTTSTDSGAQSTAPAQQAEAPTTPQGDELYTPAYKPNGKEVAIIKTSKGSIKVELLGKDAPIHVGNFVELAEKGFYTNLKFHRFEPGFVIQGGDPNTKDLTSEQVAAGSPGLGTGNPGYAIKGEFAGSTNKHLDGTLAMARSQSPDSAGSQFYFTLGPQSFLDGNYTVFGQTIEGLDVIHQLGVGDVIESVTIENANK